MVNLLGTFQTDSRDGMMWSWLHKVFKRQCQLVSFLKKKVLNLMLLILRCWLEPSKHTILLQSNLVNSGSHTISHIDWMRDIMVLFRAWIRLRLRKSTVKNRSCNGGAAMIYHLQKWNLITQDILDLMLDTDTCLLKSYQQRNLSRLLSTAFSPIGMMLSAPRSSMANVQLSLLTVTHYVLSLNTWQEWTRNQSSLITSQQHAHLYLSLMKISNHWKTITYWMSKN